MNQIPTNLRHPVKVPDRLYFRIGDVAEIAGVKPHVLRYWESEFPVISPEKSATGQRVYRRVDVESVLLIRHLLYVERYSIEGARKRIRELKKSGELKQYLKDLIVSGEPVAQVAANIQAGEPVQVVSATEGSVSLAADVSSLRSLARGLRELTRAPIQSVFKY